MTAAELRRDLSERGLRWAEHRAHEMTYGTTPSVLFQPGDDGSHGNFLPASWRRIARHPAWAARLEKSYTASRRVAWAGARERAELDCANSSDALLMNVFCYPGLLRREAMTRLLGVERGERPRFGVRLEAPLERGLVDRTEVDLLLGDLLVEAKLTETDFQVAPMRRVERYRDLERVFEVEELPRGADGRVRGYQLIRNILGAVAQERRFAVLCDARRTDLHEQWFQVLRAVRSAEVRSRLRLLTWQELAAASPRGLKQFLAIKYGIAPCPGG